MKSSKKVHKNLELDSKCDERPLYGNRFYAVACDILHSLVKSFLDSFEPLVREKQWDAQCKQNQTKDRTLGNPTYEEMSIHCA